jgi:hypothetical protein
MIVSLLHSNPAIWVSLGKSSTDQCYPPGLPIPGGRVWIRKL